MLQYSGFPKVLSAESMLVNILILLTRILFLNCLLHWAFISAGDEN